MSLCYNTKTYYHTGKGTDTLGYREFAKDYAIEYVDRPGHKRPKAVRVYVGPWYRFAAPAERIRFLRWFYLIGLGVLAILLLIPMCIDCTFTRIWYIQTPAAAAWIPWVLAACATWRLWTAGERVTREHNSLLGARMSGSCLFLMGFCLISCVGCVYALTVEAAAAVDYVICACCMLSGVVSIALFSRRKGLDMVMIDPA